jgi:hypothetical protein
VNENDIERVLLREYGIRVQPGMSRYVLNRLRAAARGPIFGQTISVIGGDARTGVPMRALVALDRLNQAAALDNQTATTPESSSA